MVLIYSDIETPRLHFTCELIFMRLLGIGFRISSNPVEFNNSEGPKINYSSEIFPGSLHILPSGLVSESGIILQQLPIGQHEGFPTLFPNNGNTSDYPFDLFAAVFFMTSRYEEYLPHTADSYGRFPAYESLAYKNGFLEVPIVNIWSLNLAGCLKNTYPEITFNRQNYKYLPTIDIDIAFKYKYRSLFKTIGGTARSVLHGDIHEVLERVAVLLNTTKDPFDTYNFIYSTHQNYKLTSIYFILLADYGGLDKSLSPDKEEFRNFILSLSTHASLGLHPSFLSNSDSRKFNREVALFNFITALKLTRTRQHFLKLSLPDTYRMLEKAGVKEDYSMGFADIPGFRAGICIPFPFYDLKLEKQTNLMLYPLVLMDGTLNDYLHLSADEAIRRSKVLIDRVKKVDGTMITLWHNESLSETGRWKGWKTVYEELVAYASNIDII